MANSLTQTMIVYLAVQPKFAQINEKPNNNQRKKKKNLGRWWSILKNHH